MKQLTFDDLKQGRMLRDAGIQATESANERWIDLAVRVAVKHGKPGFPVTGESLREVVEGYGLFPSSPHAWGALTRRLLLEGWIEDTGKTVSMKSPKSHARRTPLWRWVL